ncbi:MAG: helicase C-terminal domain-containing protein, partial [Clostridia bacterium]|nr:helicase C-terminal domain-containing protein [Clostridia bacterium]
EKFNREVFLRDELSNDDVVLTVSGRIDGLLTGGDRPCIYEVKSTGKDINEIGMDEFPEHWGQAICYAGIYLKTAEFDSIEIKIVYINRDTKEKKEFGRYYEKEQLSEIYNDYAGWYLSWMTQVRKWEIIRNISIRNLPFPFPNYRMGQREMAEKSYIAIRDEKRLFVQAPTGIGKTMGAMFPAVKALGEGLVDKIFYLTAKTVTAGIAVENYKKLSDAGLNLRTVVITAKDKVCPLEKRNCDPDYCDRAHNYYERAPKAVKDILGNQFLDRVLIRKYADLYNICPFELALDASLYCDMIIGDYNYLFDPRVKLLRFFEEVKEEYCFLVDEAHNLVDRGRDMFSCEIEKRSIMEVKRNTDPDWDDMKKRLEIINREMLDIKKERFEDTKGTAYDSSRDIPGRIVTACKRCAAVMEKYIDHEMDDEYNSIFMDLYFNLLFFCKVAELYDERYATFYILKSNNLKIKLMCLDPSYLLGKAMDKGRSAILFSATLEPSSYYMNILGGRDEDSNISLPSPFPDENLKVAVEGRISTKYRDRDLSYDDIAFVLRDSFKVRTGNYMVFFPSYKYLNSVLSTYEQICGDMEILVQQPGMDEVEREIFLKRFDDHGDSTLVAFAVMGGIFGEGIDLAGDKLSGVAIIGTGLPMVCPEREMIKQYYDETNGRGFDYAYTYPGLNRVLQAAGRVIRSEVDKGFVVLIDTRFAGRKYRALYPYWWSPRYFTGNDWAVSNYISDF